MLRVCHHYSRIVMRLPHMFIFNCKMLFDSPTQHRCIHVLRFLFTWHGWSLCQESLMSGGNGTTHHRWSTASSPEAHTCARTQQPPAAPILPPPLSPAAPTLPMTPMTACHRTACMVHIYQWKKKTMRKTTTKTMAMTNTFSEHLQRGIFENFNDISRTPSNGNTREVVILLKYLTIEKLKTLQS